jgi:hypothetical protein
MDEHIGPRQQFTLSVVDVDLDQQCTRRGIDRSAVADKAAVNTWPGYSSSVTVGVAPACMEGASISGTAT